jgi:acyl carrier protein
MGQPIGSFGADRELPSRQALEETVARLVACTLGKKAGSIQPDAPLFSSQAGFDSFSLMEIVLNLEDTLGFKIPDEDLDPDVFQSIKTIAAYIHSRLERRS